jgi:hypothetical protein
MTALEKPSPRSQTLLPRSLPTIVAEGCACDLRYGFRETSDTGTGLMLYQISFMNRCSHISKLSPKGR